jgi:hypothetical protein
MLSFIVKWMPLLTIAAGSTAAADKLKPVLDYSRVVAVQVEVNEIGKMLALDRVTDGAIVSPDAFPDYLRQHMRASSSSPKGSQVRDLAQDQWGSPYKLETGTSKAKVLSAGPDRRFGTGDDIYSYVLL